MQSADYVPGVSGWKVGKELIEINGRPWGSVRIGDLEKTDDPNSPLEPLEEISRAEVLTESIARCEADEGVATHIGAMQCNLPKPFVVVDGVTYIRQDHVDKSSVQSAKLAPQWTVKLKLVDGQYVAAGIGVGIASQFLVNADKYRINCMCCGGPAGFDQK